jgi:hypothetical protein
MYQYPYTKAPSESYQLPLWLSNYYSNRDAGLFGSEANKFFESRPSLAYAEQVDQTPTAYSQVPSGIPKFYIGGDGIEDFGLTDPSSTGVTSDISVSDISSPDVPDISFSDIVSGIEEEVTDFTTDIESEFSNISNEVESLSNYDLNDLSLSDVQTGLNSTIGTIALNALSFTPFAPVARAVSLGLAAANAYDSITQANQSRGMFGLANMSFEDAVATGFGFSGYDFTDAERADIAGVHGTVGDVGAPGANAPGSAGWDAQVADLPSGLTGPDPDEAMSDWDSAVADLPDGLDVSEDVDEGDSGGDGGGDGKVICTALKDMGMLDKELWKYDGEYGKTLPSVTREGYWSWGVPTALYIRKHKWAAKAIKPVVTQVAKEMAYRVGYGKGSKIGKALLYFGLPLCNLLGSRLKKHTVTA